MTGQADAAEASLLAKIDIEGSEYAMFENMDIENLKKFKEVIFEFHFIDNHENQEKGLKVQKRFEEAGFRVTHIHGNNCCGMYKYGPLSVPALVEVTYVQGAPQQQCLGSEPARSDDHKNVIRKDDLGDWNVNPDANTDDWEESLDWDGHYGLVETAKHSK